VVLASKNPDHALDDVFDVGRLAFLACEKVNQDFLDVICRLARFGLLHGPVYHPPPSVVTDRSMSLEGGSYVLSTFGARQQ
jgi:hypothetical protein